jgi:hypothetical protein
VVRSVTYQNQNQASKGTHSRHGRRFECRTILGKLGREILVVIQHEASHELFSGSPEREDSRLDTVKLATQTIHADRAWLLCWVAIVLRLLHAPPYYVHVPSLGMAHMTNSILQVNIDY